MLKMKNIKGKERNLCHKKLFTFSSLFAKYQDFLGGSDGKESACNLGDPGLVPGLGRSLGEGMATHSSIPAWRIPWTEEPGGL